MSATIKYKGNTIATASNNTKTLLTAGKYLEANVVVTDNGGGGSPTLQTKTVTYTPSASQQTDTITPDVGYDGLDEVDVTVNAVSAGSATTPATTITANPTISISGNSVSASVSKTQSITPAVSAGYVSSGTAGTVTVSGSGSATIPSASAPYIDAASINSSGDLYVEIEVDSGGYQPNDTFSSTMNNAFSVQAAQTIHPSASDQSIASGKYLTGAQTIKGVTYTNLTAGNIKKDVVVKIGDSADDDRIVAVTGTYEGGGGGSEDFFDNTKPTGALTTTVSTIPEYIAYGRTGITSVTCPNVTNIKAGAFQKCTNLTSVSVGSVTTINANAFNGASKFKGVFSNLATIGSSQAATFSGTAFTEVSDTTFPSLTSIDANTTFNNCKSITKVHLSNLTKLGQNNYGGCFNGCTELLTVVLPSITAMSDQNFKGCTKLTAADMYSVIGTAQTYANTALNTLVIRGNSVAPLSNINAFNGTAFASGGAGGTLYVPNSLKSNYQSASNWSTILGYANNSIVAIEGSAYENYYVDGTAIPTP